MIANILYHNEVPENIRPYSMKSDMIKDLNLNKLFEVMAKKDEYILSVVKNMVMIPLTDPKDIIFRQNVLEDCIQNREIIETFYNQVSKTMKQIESYEERVEQQRKAGGALSKTGDIYATLEILFILIGGIQELKYHRSKASDHFESKGMLRFCEMIDYTYKGQLIDEIREVIEEMSFLTSGGELTVTAGIAEGMKAGNAVVNGIVPVTEKHGAVYTMIKNLSYKLFRKDIIVLNDSALIYETRELENNCLLHLLDTYGQFIQELRSFFESIRYQIAFCLGNINYVTAMKHLRLPVCIPVVLANQGDFQAKGIYDLGLALQTHKHPVPNYNSFQKKRLLLITGANQGGKSTYLRAIGTAQVLMQCGMMVPGESYRNDLYQNIMTHFTRREDQAMNRGRLEEELKRMNQIVKNILNPSLVLLNESFASTTEQDGSAIAKDIISAFYKKNVTVYMVTHLYPFVKSVYDEKWEHAVFLSAGRKESGERTFLMEEAEPTETSYGIDLYDEILLGSG